MTSEQLKALTLEGFDQLMQTLERVLAAIGRPLAMPHARLRAASV